MGKKKSKKTASAAVAEPAPETSDSADFAAQLLAEMGLEEPAQTATPAAPLPETTLAETPKKRNRRKEKLAERAAATQKLMDDAQLEADAQPKHRQIEIDALRAKFDARNLREIDIRPDGNCLFNSVADQLEHIGAGAPTAQSLREQAAQYIQSHRDDFVPFLLDEETGELGDVDEYCHKLTTTPMWGGEMEVLALASSLKRPIEVIQQGPSHVVGENFGGERLLVSYYTRIYGLGAHYNSVRASSEPGERAGEL